MKTTGGRFRYRVTTEDRICFTCPLPECNEDHPNCLYTNAVKRRRNRSLLDLVAQNIVRKGNAPGHESLERGV